MLEICKSCPLYAEYSGLSHKVEPFGQPTSPYWILGEAPGKDEVQHNTPFIGAAGQDQDGYLRLAGLSRSLFYISNIVQCQPPGNRDPKPDEIAHCSVHLEDLLFQYEPKVIAAVGRFAAEYFLGPEFSMQYHNAIPILLTEFKGQQLNGVTIVPIYHPAAGFRNTTLITQIANGYKVLGQVIRRDWAVPRSWPMTITKVKALDFPHFPAEAPRLSAIDTETYPDGSPWCLTYCYGDGIGRIIMADDTEALTKFNTLINRPGVTTILHNALFDLGVLSQMGIHPPRYYDTMVMAYLLQDLPLGLKPLSYRLLDMTMRNYEDVILEASQAKALEYLLAADAMSWDNPEPVLVWDRGVPRIKKPQNVSRKIARILKSYYADPDYPLYSAWAKIDHDAGRGQVEGVLGLMPQASLADVEFSEALQYACADAIATLEVFEILWPRIESMGLVDTLQRDMGALPLVADMQNNGVLIAPGHFAKLDKEFEEKKQYHQDNITLSHPEESVVNPGSTQQIADLLYRLGVFHNKTTSTDSFTLDLYRDKHPVIDEITGWRKLNKLQTTYLRPLPKCAGPDGRVRSKFSMTRTTTGRLASSKPNLQNIPTATTEGAQIRLGFIASDGCVLASFDYSQIEMRIAAHMAEDDNMLRMFRDNLDVHSETAAQMFGIPLDQVDKKRHRYPAKRCGFGILYSMGALGLQTQMRSEGVEYTEQQCQNLITCWYRVFPDIARFMEGVMAYARRHGLVRDIFGRYRLVPELKSSQSRIKSAGLRQACNAPIQMGAQGVIKEAMRRLVPIYRELQEGGRYHCHPLMQIHDDLVWEISEEILPYAVDLIKTTMESAVELSIATPVDPKVGKVWGDMSEYYK